MLSYLWTLILLFATCACVSAQKIQAFWYPYQGQYLDLENKRWTGKDLGLVDKDFKQIGPKQARFSGLSIDQMYFQGWLFSLEAKNGLSQTNPLNQQKQYLDNPEMDMQTTGQAFMFATPQSLVLVKHLAEAQGFVVYGYEASGKTRFRKQIAHSQAVKTQELHYFKPYLKYLGHTPRHLVFSSYEPKIKRSVLVDLQGGDTLEFPEMAKALIRDAQDSLVIGLWVRRDSGRLQTLFFEAHQYAKISTEDFNAREDWEHETLLNSTHLYVLSYPPRASGAELRAFVLETGALSWKAEIQALSQVAEGHYQQVWISQYENWLIIEGYERDRRYLSLVDCRSGRFVDLP